MRRSTSIGPGVNFLIKQRGAKRREALAGGAFDRLAEQHPPLHAASIRRFRGSLVRPLLVEWFIFVDAVLATELKLTGSDSQLPPRSGSELLSCLKHNIKLQGQILWQDITPAKHQPFDLSPMTGALTLT